MIELSGVSSYWVQLQLQNVINLVLIGTYVNGDRWDMQSATAADTGNGRGNHRSVGHRLIRRQHELVLLILILDYNARSFLGITKGEMSGT